MGSVLQSYSILPHKLTRRALEHYTGVPTASGFDLDPGRTIALNYIDPSNVLPNSDAELALDSLLAARRSYVTFSQLVETPVGLSINKAPRSPLNWNVTYLFPEGPLSNYLATEFSAQQDVFARDTIGILNWSISVEVSYKHYGMVESGNAQIKGFQFGDATLRIAATTDFEIENFDNPDNIPVEGLILSINEHTLVANVEKSEDTGLVPSYRYDWTFGVL